MFDISWLILKHSNVQARLATVGGEMENYYRRLRERWCVGGAGGLLD